MSGSSPPANPSGVVSLRAGDRLIPFSVLSFIIDYGLDYIHYTISFGQQSSHEWTTLCRPIDVLFSATSVTYVFADKLYLAYSIADQEMTHYR